MATRPPSSSATTTTAAAQRMPLPTSMAVTTTLRTWSWKTTLSALSTASGSVAQTSTAATRMAVSSASSEADAQRQQRDRPDQGQPQRDQRAEPVRRAVRVGRGALDGDLGEAEAAEVGDEAEHREQHRPAAEAVGAERADQQQRDADAQREVERAQHDLAGDVAARGGAAGGRPRAGGSIRHDFVHGARTGLHYRPRVAFPGVEQRDRVPGRRRPRRSRADDAALAGADRERPTWCSTTG